MASPLRDTAVAQAPETARSHHGFLQMPFGKDDKFFGLLEASAEAARNSVRSLTRSTPLEPAASRNSTKIRNATRRSPKRSTRRSGRPFVTPLEREDVEVLGGALYRIPKTVRFVISLLLYAGTVELMAMVKPLRDLGGGQFDRAKELMKFAGN